MKYPIVLVEWEDSVGSGSQWEPVDDPNMDRFSCFSVGYLVAENEHSILLVPHMHPAHESIGANESGCGDMRIPKACVLKQRVLVKAK